MIRIISIFLTLCLISCSDSSESEKKFERDVESSCESPSGNKYWCDLDVRDRYLILTDKTEGLVYIECHKMPSYGRSFHTAISWNDQRDGTRGKIETRPYIRDFQNSCSRYWDSQTFEKELVILKIAHNIGYEDEKGILLALDRANIKKID